MSNAVSHEPITCPSCEYRHFSGNAICPMCGTAAPVVEPQQTLSAVPDNFKGADYESQPSNSDSQQSPPYPGVGRSVSVIVVLIGLIVVTVFFYKARRGSFPNESRSVAELKATSGQSKQENVSKRHIVHKPVGRVQQVVAAKAETAQTTSATKEDNPVELWKAVKRGSVSAEVALANLYLEGKSVSQNCEQAYMLLQTASMKGSKAADTLLKGSYPARCE